MQSIRTLTAMAAGILILSACSSAPPLSNNTAPVAPKAPAPAPAAAAPSAPSQAASVAQPKAQTTELPAYLDPKNPLSNQRSVYFEFDNFAVRPEFAQTLEMHGRYLSAHPQVNIRVEGNADERGSSEYNLALGQKRADAVAHALKVFGVKDAQMEIISFGREKPKAVGHDEAAWAQNRRVDLNYPSK